MGIQNELDKAIKEYKSNIIFHICHSPICLNKKPLTRTKVVGGWKL